MKNSSRFLFLLFFLPFSLFAQHKNPKIVLSSRAFHPTDNADSLSTLAIIDIYKTERVEWMYCTDSVKLNKLKAKGVKFSLAINPQTPDSNEYTRKGRMVNLSGERIVAPWMVTWKQKNPNWGCVNSPFFKDLFIKRTKQLIDLGAYAIVVDDSRMNHQGVEWGGCFCEHCMKKFTDYLIKKGKSKTDVNFNYQSFLKKKGVKEFDYKDSTIQYYKEFQDFQKKSAVAFLKEWKKQMKVYSGKTILLTNNYKGRWDELYSIFDGGIAETTPESLNDLFFMKLLKTTKKMRKKQMLSLVSDNTNDNLKFLMLCKKYGFDAIAPWDVFIGTDETTRKVERFYGDTRVFAPVVKNFTSFKGYTIDSSNVNLKVKLSFTDKQLEVVGKK